MFIRLATGALLDLSIVLKPAKVPAKVLSDEKNFGRYIFTFLALLVVL